MWVAQPCANREVEKVFGRKLSFNYGPKFVDDRFA